MTLLITVFAAVAATVLWYTKSESGMELGKLSLMYWGASLMWFVDAAAGYIETGAEYFTPAVSDMLNDAYLGLSVVALGLIIWLVIVLIKDPAGAIGKSLSKHK